jgi:hypothetical protein
MGKLVRDKIFDIIRASGRTAEVRQLDDATYLAALHNRLAEEARGLNELLLLSPAVKRRAGIELRPQAVDADAVAADEQIARYKTVLKSV